MGNSVSVPSRDEQPSRLPRADRDYAIPKAVPPPPPSSQRGTSAGRLPRSVERHSRQKNVGSSSRYAESITTATDKSSSEHRRARSVPQMPRRSAREEEHAEEARSSMPRTGSDAVVLRSDTRSMSSSGRRLSSQQPSSLPRLSRWRKSEPAVEDHERRGSTPRTGSETATMLPVKRNSLVKRNSRSSSARRHSQPSLPMEESGITIERLGTPRANSDSLLSFSRSNSRSSSANGRRLSQPSFPSAYGLSMEDYRPERRGTPRINSDPLYPANRRYSPPSLPSQDRPSSLIGSISRRKKNLSREKNGDDDEGYPCYYLPEGNPHPTPAVRRRSLVTQPGLATRTPKQQRRDSSGDGRLAVEGYDRHERSEAGSSRKRMAHSPARATTPSGQDYSYLGAFKPGSLRVINGAVSPCPSDNASKQSDNTETQHTTAAGVAITAGASSTPAVAGSIHRGFLSSPCPAAPSAVKRTLPSRPTISTAELSPTASTVSSAVSPTVTSPTSSTFSGKSSDYGRLYINYSRLIQPRAQGDMVWLRGSTLTDSGYGSECSLRDSMVGKPGQYDDVNNETRGFCLFTEEF